MSDNKNEISEIISTLEGAFKELRDPEKDLQKFKYECKVEVDKTQSIFTNRIGYNGTDEQTPSKVLILIQGKNDLDDAWKVKKEILTASTSGLKSNNGVDVPPFEFNMPTANLSDRDYNSIKQNLALGTVVIFVDREAHELTQNILKNPSEFIAKLGLKQGDIIVGLSDDKNTPVSEDFSKALMNRFEQTSKINGIPAATPDIALRHYLNIGNNAKEILNILQTEVCTCQKEIRDKITDPDVPQQSEAPKPAMYRN